MQEFEVKGPHEEVLEGGHAEERGSNNNRLALMTAIMATFGALLSYEASITLGEAIIFKNEASIKQTEASDQWNYYQSKNIKQILAELSLTLNTNNKGKTQQDIARYITEKAEIKKKAEHIETLSHKANEQSERFMEHHHRWETGTTMLQIAISLAAIAILTRSKWLEYASLGCACIGILFGAIAFFGF